MATETTFQFCTFAHKRDNKPRYYGLAWPKMVESLMRHKERVEKDGPLWSPTVYKGTAARGDAGVESITAAVGDFDGGASYEDIEFPLSHYEHVAHSTHSHTIDKPKFRVIIPFVSPVPAKDWPDIKARIDEHVFKSANDPGTCDESRIYYTPSCPPGAPRFTKYHEGDFLDPYSLPPSAQYIPKNGKSSEHAGRTEGVRLPLGKKALDFVANGAPLLEQRSRALAATRNYLSAGYSVDETAAAIWRGLQASKQDPDKGPWSFDDSMQITQSIFESPPSDLAASGDSVGPRMELRRHNLGYVCNFPSIGITFKVDRIKRTSEGIKAEMHVVCGIPGLPEDVSWGNLNFASVTARNSMVKILAKRTEAVSLDWESMLETVCRTVTEADREGEPFIHFDNLQPAKRVTWLVTNLLPRNHITTIFGEGGSGKSNFGLANGLSVGTGKQFVPGFWPEFTGTVAYLDYETDESEMKYREMALCAGIGYKGKTNMIYRHCQRSLPDDIAETIKLCTENNVALVIVDSVAMATAGIGDSGSDQNESIIKLYTALRLLNTTCLLIDHVSAADMEKKGPRKPYGSIYKINLARMAFDLRSTSKSGESPLHIALHNIKRNDGPLLGSVGLSVSFGTDNNVDWSKYELETIKAMSLLQNMAGAEKIRLSLAEEMKDIKEISEATGEKKDNIYQVLGRGQDDGVIFKDGKRYGLISLRHTYKN